MASQALRKWRERSKLTQMQAAIVCGIDAARFSVYERGAGIPGLKVATRIQDATGGKVLVTDWVKPIQNDEPARKAV